MGYYAKKQSVELGLSVLCVLAKPGETMQQIDIAEICECSKSLIQHIEQSAFKKIRAAMKPDDYLD